MWCLVVSIPDLCLLSYFAGRTHHIVKKSHAAAQICFISTYVVQTSIAAYALDFPKQSRDGVQKFL